MIDLSRTHLADPTPVFDQLVADFRRLQVLEDAARLALAAPTVLVPLAEVVPSEPARYRGRRRAPGAWTSTDRTVFGVLVLVVVLFDVACILGAVAP